MLFRRNGTVCGSFLTPLPWGVRRRSGASLHAGLTVLVLLLVGALVPADAGAQAAVEWDAAREQVTRAELEDLRDRLEAQAESSAYSARMRTQARERMELIQRRLTQGDFQPGDRIDLVVEGEDDLTGEFIVRAGRILELPAVGEIPLTGVLRSELQDALEERLGNFIRNPRVRARALIRLSVLGQVGSPGFYVIPADMPVTDALTMAGGPTATADLRDLRVERGDTRIWEGELMEMAVIRGQTLDQMNLQAGDRIVVPSGGAQRTGWETFRVVSVTVGSIASLAYALTRIF